MRALFVGHTRAVATSVHEAGCMRWRGRDTRAHGARGQEGAARAGSVGHQVRSTVVARLARCCGHTRCIGEFGRSMAESPRTPRSPGGTAIRNKPIMIYLHPNTETYDPSAGLALLVNLSSLEGFHDVRCACQPCQHDELLVFS